jgi:FixJ family two-component response regulator
MKELEPRVFVVDDDRSVRTKLVNLLAREDYTVELFVSAEEYLARVPHSGPACIVLEVHLPGRHAKLTPRGFEVFRLVIAGLVNKEIGAELGVTFRTMKEHCARVMQKIGVLSVAELVWLAP